MTFPGHDEQGYGRREEGRRMITHVIARFVLDVVAVWLG
jgi:antibiotic biosynthesis monooxygenase (ABM) superfamily enzyme